MTFGQQVAQDVNQAISYGQSVRFKYFTVSTSGTVYDDDVKLTQSGNDLWCTGLYQPLNSLAASEDALLLEQGFVIQSDKKLYLNGSIQTSGLWRVGIGSPVVKEYSMVPNGVHQWELDTTVVYKRVFLRNLTTGSLAGE